MIHRVAVLWLQNENGELLMAQRAFGKIADPGVWGPSATGHIDEGESVIDALKREAEEELSLYRAKYDPKFLFEVDFDHPDGEKRVFYIYVAKVPRNISDTLTLQTEEVAAVRWASIDEIREIMRNNVQELVPSAEAFWPRTFDAIQNL